MSCDEKVPVEIQWYRRSPTMRSLPRPACAALAIALPWLALYIAGIYCYYAADAKRWDPKGIAYTHIPYISGLLGDGEDSAVEANWRFVGWCVGVLPTIVARWYVLGRAKKGWMGARWMVLYIVAWVLCVASAEWDKFEDTNPVTGWVRGDTAHFILSLVFFIVAGAEMAALSFTQLFPKHKWKAVGAEMLYVVCYCSCFMLYKEGGDDFRWMSLHFIPILEHLMLFAHVMVDSVAMYMRAKNTESDEIRSGMGALLLQAGSDAGVLTSDSV